MCQVEELLEAEMSDEDGDLVPDNCVSVANGPEDLSNQLDVEAGDEACVAQ